MLSKLHKVALGILLSICIAQTSEALPLLGSQEDLNISNEYSDGNHTSTMFHSGDVIYGIPSSSLGLGSQATFTGLNSTGSTQTMSIQASGSAQADQFGQGHLGVLRSSTSLTVTNPYYNASNPAYVGQDNSINPYGSPDSIDLVAQARFDDQLAVDSSKPISSLNVFVTLNGSTTYSDPTIAGPLTQGFIAATDHFGKICSSCGEGTFSGSGTFNKTFKLNIAVTDPSAVELGILFYTSNLFDLKGGGYDESGTYTDTMDFSHTIQVTGLQGLDSSGSIVALNSVISSTGFNYPVTPVPLPSAFWLFGSGLLCMAGINKRKNCASLN